MRELSKGEILRIELFKKAEKVPTLLAGLSAACFAGSTNDIRLALTDTYCLLDEIEADVNSLSELQQRPVASNTDTVVKKTERLSDDAVREIRLEIKRGRAYGQIASDYGTSPTLIGRIASGSSYGHVLDEEEE